MIKHNQKIEIEKLKAEIERLKKELKKRKKYGLVWEDKPEDVVEMCKEKLPVLKEVKDKEIITDKNKPVNLLIEGDNYHALSVLNYTHAGKVDVIYIDPPYNTGNKDFIFNDRYVDREDAYRHSKWLSFMEKRLKLAKNLLKDTGVIFISIDDNEVAQLKLLMDHPDLFGEGNVEIMVWNKIPEEGTAGQGKMKITYRFRIDHEYIVVAYKNRDKVYFNKPLRIKPTKLEYDNADNDPRGPWISCEICKSEKKSNPKGKNYYTVITPKGVAITRQWHFSKEEFLKLDKDGRIYWGNGTTVPRLKKFINEPRPTTPTSIIGNISQTEGNRDLKNIFHEMVFDNPKPVNLMKYLLEISTNSNSLILDFMAGTGTTGHAVLELNKEDGGNRQFILCTNNENNICTDVCYPRIKKVIEGYKNLKGEWMEGLGGNLKYFRTDFVDAEPSDKNKIKLTHQATEMLCIKEGTFEKVIDNERFKIFKNSDHYTGIIWDQTAIPEFKRAIKDIKAKFSVYVFSLGDETFNDEFKDIKQKVQLSPIPEAILRVYRRIFK